MALKEAASTIVAAGLAVDLVAVLAAITNSQPRVMTIRDGTALPSGPFELDDRSLQSGLREWVERQTGHPLGYVEQLYTFADRDRAAEGTARRFISISYLGLTREERAKSAGDAGWRNWYDYFPWEDRRAAPPAFVEETMIPRLRAWAKAAGDAAKRRERAERLAISFGLDGSPWNEELILQRYELLYEAGLVEEAHHPVGRRRALDEPRLDLVEIELESILGVLGDQRIEIAEPLDEAAVARRARVGNDDMIERTLLCARAGETDDERHLQFFLLLSR